MLDRYYADLHTDDTKDFMFSFFDDRPSDEPTEEEMRTEQWFCNHCKESFEYPVRKVKCPWCGSLDIIKEEV